MPMTRGPLKTFRALAGFVSRILRFKLGPSSASRAYPTQPTPLEPPHLNTASPLVPPHRSTDHPPSSLPFNLFELPPYSARSIHPYPPLNSERLSHLPFAAPSSTNASMTPNFNSNSPQDTTESDFATRVANIPAQYLVTGLPQVDALIKLPETWASEESAKSVFALARALCEEQRARLRRAQIVHRQMQLQGAAWLEETLQARASLEQAHKCLQTGTWSGNPGQEGSGIAACMNGKHIRRSRPPD
ncbi:hypothetical protein BV25DRAFT_1841361 [Artomyces pyxidatus]|uniref:Uncharacterized protein n=1 Tax=Artomyces pyxidatus TaxID=48021 RepID=A0ACB8SNU1_9AGAM|nr:hypothetical protein BV25DRAFT_1841361 [Artomyces pyxidatus]